jgi:hypothetical protein
MASVMHSTKYPRIGLMVSELEPYVTERRAVQREQEGFIWGFLVGGLLGALGAFVYFIS